MKRQQIIEKSANLFKAYGIRTITMDEISSELGLSKKTLYQIIDDKNELVSEAIDFEYNILNKSFNVIAEESIDAIEELIRVNAILIRFLNEINPVSVNDLKKLYQNIYSDTITRFTKLFTNVIIKCIKQGKDEGTIRADLNEELITNIHTERINEKMEGSKFWDKKNEIPNYIKEMVTYYLRGMVTKKGEKLLDNYMNDFTKYLKE